MPQGQREQANVEFFTARFAIAARVDMDKIIEATRQRYQKLKEQGLLPEGMSQTRILSELAGQERMRDESVEVGSQKIWEFYNIKVADPNTRVFVRFKYETSIEPPDEKVYGLWSVGDLRQLGEGFGGMGRAGGYLENRVIIVR